MPHSGRQGPIPRVHHGPGRQTQCTLSSALLRAALSDRPLGSLILARVVKFRKKPLFAQKARLVPRVAVFHVFSANSGKRLVFTRAFCPLFQLDTSLKTQRYLGVIAPKNELKSTKLPFWAVLSLFSRVHGKQGPGQSYGNYLLVFPREKTNKFRLKRASSAP